ncbi:MAG: hypothetical protein ACRCUQ_03150 [Alphaproteobacteria bacterium]
METMTTPAPFSAFNVSARMGLHGVQVERDAFLNFAAKNLEGGIRRWGALQEQTTLLEQRHPEQNADPYLHPTQMERKPLKKIICTTEGRDIKDVYSQLFSSDSSKISFAELVFKPSFQDQGALGILIKGNFVGKDLSSKDFASFFNNSENKFLYVMAVNETNPDCMIYRKAQNKPIFIFRTEKRSIMDRLIDDLGQNVDMHISNFLESNQENLISLQDIDENSQYAYVRLMSKNPNNGETGLIESEIGRINLTASQFQEQISGLSENLIVASYSPAKNEITCALLTQNGCLPLPVNETQGGLRGIIAVRENFLKNIFSNEGPASFLQNSHCLFGSPAVPKIRLSGTTTSTTTTPPLPIVSLGYDDFEDPVGLDYNSLGDYNTSPSSVSLNPDSPQASFWRRHLSSLIGGGVAVLGVLGASVAGIYCWCTANKEKRARNEAYDGEMFPLRQISVTPSN